VACICRPKRLGQLTELHGQKENLKNRRVLLQTPLPTALELVVVLVLVVVAVVVLVMLLLIGLRGGGQRCWEERESKRCYGGGKWKKGGITAAQTRRRLASAAPRSRHHRCGRKIKGGWWTRS